MKKLIFIAIVITILLIPTVVSATSVNSVYIVWTWPAGVEKSAYFFPTQSGLVHAWTYGHANYGDSHWVIKPYEKFPNATTCDEGYIGMNTSWTPQGIYNTSHPEYKQAFNDLFPNLSQEYLLCIYPIE